MVDVRHIVSVTKMYRKRSSFGQCQAWLYGLQNSKKLRDKWAYKLAYNFPLNFQVLELKSKARGFELELLDYASIKSSTWHSPTWNDGIVFPVPVMWQFVYFRCVVCVFFVE